MIDLVPLSLDIFFIATAALAFVAVVAGMLRSGDQAIRKWAHILSLLLLLWLVFQSTLALNGWYMDREAWPPHLIFPFVVWGIIGAVLFALPAGRAFIRGLDADALMWIHVLRIPVEVALYLLATWKQVPWSMTFAGHNFDLLSGMTAPVIWWLGYRREMLSRPILVGWHLMGLALLAIVVVTAIGALPSPGQAWDFSQPNYAIQHFPYIWLPSFIVPVVLLSHLILLHRLLSRPVLK